MLKKCIMNWPVVENYGLATPMMMNWIQHLWPGQFRDTISLLTSSAGIIMFKEDLFNGDHLEKKETSEDKRKMEDDKLSWDVKRRWLLVGGGWIMVFVVASRWGSYMIPYVMTCRMWKIFSSACTTILLPTKVRCL